MPAWRLGRFVGSLLVLAGLAVGGFAAQVGSVDGVQPVRHGVVADSETPAPDVPVGDPETGFATFGWNWD